MLTGGYQHNIDIKGRMIMPAKFRDELGDKFVVTKGLDNCLFVFSLSEWEKLNEKLSGLSLSQGREIQRFFYGGMSDCEIDKQGRIVVPADLREYAGLEKDVTVVGLIRRAEIWNTEAWNARDKKVTENPDDVARRMEELGI